MFNKFISFGGNLTAKYGFAKVAGIGAITLGLLSGVVLVQQNQLLDRSALEGGPEVYFEPSQQNVSSGSSNNSYDIYLDTKAHDVTGITLSITYDSRYINPVSVTPVSPFVDLCSLSQYCDTDISNGIITMNAGSGLSPVSGVTKLATIMYDAADEDIATAFTFSSGTVASSVSESLDALGEARDGSICIGNCSGGTTATITSSPTNTPTPRGGPGPTDGLTPTNSPTPSVTSTPTPTTNPRSGITPITSPTGTPGISNVPTPIITIQPSISSEQQPESQPEPCRFRVFGVCFWRG